MEPSMRSVAGISGLQAGEDVKTVAEGVKTEAQLEALRELGCEEAQGALFAMPLTPAEAEAWVSRERAGTAAAGRG